MAGLDREQTEALIAYLAQLEQEKAQQEALPQATRHYDSPAHYYEHRSQILSPPLERRDYQIKTSTTNQMTQHQFYGLQSEHPISHNEERNQQRQRFEPGSIGFLLAAEHEQEMSYISNRWSQQRYEYKPGSIGYELNKAQGLQNQSPTTNAFQPQQQPFASARATNNFQTRQQSYAPSAPFQPNPAPTQTTNVQGSIDRLTTLVEQVILEQQKTNEKIDIVYADLNGKFDSLSSHIKRLSLQADQQAEWAKQRQSEQKPTEEDHEPRIEQQEETTSPETCEQLQGETQPDLDAQSVSRGDELLSTHVAEDPVESPSPATEETVTQHDTTRVAIGAEPAAEEVRPPKRIFIPPSGTPLLRTLQEKDDPRQFAIPYWFKGVKFEGSMCCIPGFQRSCPLSPPRRLPPKRIPRSPKVHPPDTAAFTMMVARIHHQQLLYAKYSGVDGEDPVSNSRAN